MNSEMDGTGQERFRISGTRSPFSRYRNIGTRYLGLTHRALDSVSSTGWNPALATCLLPGGRSLPTCDGRMMRRELLRSFPRTLTSCIT